MMESAQPSELTLGPQSSTDTDGLPVRRLSMGHRTPSPQNVEEGGGLFSFMKPSDIKKAFTEEELVFSDGYRKVDFVLVLDTTVPSNEKNPPKSCFRRKKKKGNASDTNNRNANALQFTEEDEDEDADIELGNVHGMQKDKEEPDDNEIMRRTFLRSLKDAGLEIEITPHLWQKGIIFYKIHLPWETSAHYAQVLHMKMPIVDADIYLGEGPYAQFRCLNGQSRIFKRLPQIKHYYSMNFARSAVESYFFEDDESAFFRASRRSEIVDYIMSRAVYEYSEDYLDDQKGLISILNKGVFNAAFPLHSGPIKFERNSIFHTIATAMNFREIINTRALLHTTFLETWTQPLDYIWDYFGANFGFYFSLLDFLSKMLVPVILVSIIAIIFGAANYAFLPRRAIEVCDREGLGDLVLCPRCDRCSNVTLYQLCDIVMSSVFFDNKFTVILALFMAFWSVTFSKLWTRVEARESFAWHVDECYNRESMRPQFQDLEANRKSVNAITEQIEPSISTGRMCCRFVISVTVTAVIFIITFVIAFLVIAYSILMETFAYITSNHKVGDLLLNHLLVVFTTTAIFLLVIFSIDGLGLYHVLARTLANIEQPRTQSQWENSFLTKLFAFKFVNEHVYLLHIAFFRELISYSIPQPFGITVLYGPEISLVDLCFTLIVMMVGNIAIRAIRTLIKKCRKKGPTGVPETGYNQMESDYLLEPIPDMFVTNGYVDMVLLYALVAMFTVSCPLAPMIALFISVTRIRSETKQLLCKYRRPVAKRTRGIGKWNNIVHNISTLAVFTNAAIIAFSTEFIPETVFALEFADKKSYTAFTYTENSQKDCLHRNFHDFKAQAFWQVLAWRVLFFMAFCGVVLVYRWLLALLVTLTARGLDREIMRENFVTMEVLIAPGRYTTMRETFAQQAERRRSTARSIGGSFSA